MGPIIGKTGSYNCIFLPTFRMFLKILHSVQLTITMRVLRFSRGCGGGISFSDT
jgi:hypothetical protein